MTLSKGHRALSEVSQAAVERFRSSIGSLVPDENGCLIWPHRLDRYGYGQVAYWMNSRNNLIGAHRLAVLLTDEIPPMMVVDHLCRVRACVNREHLRITTNGENVRAGLAGYANPHKTHCKHGHPLEGDNVRVDRQVDGGPKRVCRECRRLVSASYRARKAAH